MTAHWGREPHQQREMPRNHALLLALVAILLLLGALAYGLDRSRLDRTDPQAVADAFAGALASGDTDTVCDTVELLTGPAADKAGPDGRDRLCGALTLTGAPVVGDGACGTTWFYRYAYQPLMGAYEQDQTTLVVRLEKAPDGTYSIRRYALEREDAAAVDRDEPACYQQRGREVSIP